MNTKRHEIELAESKPPMPGSRCCRMDAADPVVKAGNSHFNSCEFVSIRGGTAFLL
jgi:hypothetical protein